MRIPLIVRVLFILLIPFLQLLLFTGVIENAYITKFIISKPVLLILIGFLISVILAIAAAKNFRDGIAQIEKILQKPGKSRISVKDLRQVPPDMEGLLFAIKKSIYQIYEEKASLIAERKIFDSILGNMSDGILIVDGEGVVTMVNTSACRIFRVKEENAIGHSLAEVLRDYRINDLFRKCTQSKLQEVASLEIAEDSSYIQCIATPLDSQMPGSILFLFQDLTRTRQLELVRRDFVSNVSHELRTPLTSLKLITETLQDGAMYDHAAAKRFLEKMDGEVDILAQLVEELLELSRIESGRVPLERRYIQVDELILKACDRMAMQAKRAGLSLECTAGTQLPAVFLDPIKIEQVLVNLIHNAVKFTPPAGKVEVSAIQKSGTIVFFVKDNGVGIPPKDLERIFERFFKTDRSRSERGTGLGLSISRHLVEAHQGKIWAESQPGIGSTFFFSIPII